MEAVVAEHIKCPKCQASLHATEGVRPSFCLQCRFPVMLVAGKYQLVSVLGEGGFGTVYEARHIHLTRDPRRVIKVLKPELLAADTMRERFAREVQVTSALSQRNHHIVRVYDDFGEIPNFGLFYVMEYLEGEPLGDMLDESEGFLPLDRCYHLFEQLCMAMQDAHEEGIIHRDIKPDNMLIVKHLRDDFHLKVIDFGIARPTEPNKKLTNYSQGMLGTPAYMAPEQLSQQIGPHVDIYAMGAVLFELLVGHTPFAYVDGSAQTARTPAELIAAKLMETPPRVDQITPESRGVSAAMADVVATALSRDLDHRFASVAALERAFKQARDEPVIPDFLGGLTLDDGPDLDDPSQTQDILGSHAKPPAVERLKELDMLGTLPYAIELEGLLDITPTNAVSLRPAHSDEGLPFSPERSNTLSEPAAPMTPESPLPGLLGSSDETAPLPVVSQPPVQIDDELPPPPSPSKPADEEVPRPSPATPAPGLQPAAPSAAQPAKAPDTPSPASPPTESATAAPTTPVSEASSSTPQPSSPAQPKASPAASTPRQRKATPPKSAPPPAQTDGVGEATQDAPASAETAEFAPKTLTDDDQILILSPKQITPTPSSRAGRSATPPQTPAPEAEPVLTPKAKQWQDVQSIDLDPEMLPGEAEGMSGQSMRSIQVETRKRVVALIVILIVLITLGYAILETMRQDGLFRSSPARTTPAPLQPAGLAPPGDTRTAPAPPRRAVDARNAPRRAAPRRRIAPRKRHKRRRRAIARTTRYCPKDRRRYWLRLQLSGMATSKLRIKGPKRARLIADKRGFCLGGRSLRGRVTISSRRKGALASCSFPFRKYRPYRVIRMQKASAKGPRASDYCAR